MKWLGVLLLSAAAFGAKAQPAGPAPMPGETVIAEFHAEGAQVYECKAGPGGGAQWAFREPVATLLADGRTAGRHYAGPSWELADGSLVTAKPASSKPGAGPGDIPLLRLDVTGNSGKGELARAAAVLRLDTAGGGLQGACGTQGAFRIVPYSARYVFLAKP